MTSDTATDPLEVLAELLTTRGKNDPYRLYEALWAHGPVLDFGSQVVLIGYDECSRALREPRLLSIDGEVQDVLHPGWQEHSAWRGLTQIMLFRNSPAHERLRRVFSPLFTSTRLAAMRPVAERCARADVERFRDLLAGGDPVDLVTELAFPYPMDVLGELLGIPEADRPAFRHPITAVATTYEPTTELGDLAEADAGMDFMSDYLSDLVASRRNDPADDLTSELVRAQAEGCAISDEELVLNIMLLLVGGVEAPMDLFAKAIRIAAGDPNVRAGLRERGPAFGAAVFEETMRFDPPVHTLIRLAGDDVDLPGVHVREGTRLTLIVAAANRDPRRYHEPHRFDADRTDKQHLTFSAGGHYCLGAGLARLQGEALLPAVFDTIPDLRLAGPPTFRDTIVQHGFAQLPVTIGD